MGIITKTIKVFPRGRAVAHYKKMGYDAKQGEELEVKVEDLSPCSTEIIEAECDYCGKLLSSIKYVDYNAQTKNGTVKLCCLDCVPLKRGESILKKYGNKNPMAVPELKKRHQEAIMKKYGCNSPTQVPEIREKQKKTLIEHYGVDNPSLSKEIQNKRKQTFIEKYGVENPLLDPIVKEKVRQTNLELYGVENVFYNKDIQDKKNAILTEKYGSPYPLQNKECLEKMKKTNMEKYGFEYIPQLEETKQKVKKTNLERCGYESYLQSPEFLEKWFAKNGSNFVRSSRQQQYLCNLYNGVLNHPFKCFALDIFLPEDKLDIEFDGSGHKMSISIGTITEEDFEKKELYRNVAIKKEGYKQMRIISSKDRLPQDDILLQMLQDAKQYFSDYPNHSWIEFSIDTSTVRNAEHKEGVPYDFGELRTIKDKDIENIKEDLTEIA